MDMIQWKCPLLLCFCILLISSVSSARKLEEGSFGIKAVNLGNWLVTEGWIKPSLFKDIENKDLLDGTKLRLQSVTTNTYLSAELGGGSTIVANRTTPDTWETFRLWRVDASTFQFRVDNGKFMGLDGYAVMAVADAAGTPPKFQIERYSGDQKRVRIKAEENGMYLRVTTEGAVTADAPGDGGWGDNDPTVFAMKVVGTMEGEYQITNGYGPTRAREVMQAHWAEYIVEDDFRFMKEKGLNGVRIPVGWWIAQDPTPPLPYVGGSLNALDNAFAWANTHGLKVIIDLHAAEDSQNGDQHSSSRDGSLEWGMTEESIRNTVGVIEFLTARYANDSALYAVELLNEPRAPVGPKGPGVRLATLKKYYNDGYYAVRKYSKDVYVIMSNRIGGHDPKELFDLANGKDKVVVDVHYYNLFAGDDTFRRMNVEDNINYVNQHRAGEIAYLNQNGPLIFVGEWCVAMENEASNEGYQRYARAQLDVFGRATFGWAYWTYKNFQDHWSMKKMINQGIITL